MLKLIKYSLLIALVVINALDTDINLQESTMAKKTGKSGKGGGKKC